MQHSVFFIVKYCLNTGHLNDSLKDINTPAYVYVYTHIQSLT